MMCCASGAGFALDTARMIEAERSRNELLAHSRKLAVGMRQTELSVPDAHCGSCIQAIESHLRRLPGVEHARLNLSTRRVTVRWRDGTAPPLIETLQQLGYAAHLSDEQEGEKDEALAELIRAVAISGFAAGNIMLLSVSVWSGAEDATRDLFHWVSALIAIPVLAFAGRIYFRSAWSALRQGRMNMDVPISVGVSLAYGMSLYETIRHGQHAYFDAAVSLLFFLLIGRTLDHLMRSRARLAVDGLARLAPRGAMILRQNGSSEYVPLGDVEPGMRFILAAGERVPVDGTVIQGISELDCALATGESVPKHVTPGDAVQAGTLNLTGPLMIEARVAAKDSFLSEMVRLMEAAEGGRARYRRIADRVSAHYAPLVHLTAGITFLGWMAISGDWHKAITIAIAVLIITCPCALGLAVPIVQVMAARRLFENGIMVKDGAAMERLAEVDTAVFDKTGTLTLGLPRLINAGEIDKASLALARAIAAHSRHPAARAIHAAVQTGHEKIVDFETVSEIPGFGIEACLNGMVYRLGRAEWALALGCKKTLSETESGTILTRSGEQIAQFKCEDALRKDAANCIVQLKEAGIDVEIMSGDQQAAVESIARTLSIERFKAETPPGAKVARLKELASRGGKVLMIGDGLNDAPALAAAYVSMAPATAVDIGRTAADFVFLHQGLMAVPFAIRISRRAGELIRQNFMLAITYNAVAVPIAIAGYATPLVAAIAMSLSSLLVIANAMRLRARDHDKVDRLSAEIGYAGAA